ncbi:MAG: DUF4124 domain-containing protein [Candidatus Rariloculaceae bacterium]
MANRLTFLTLVALLLGTSQTWAQELYRWVDEEGMVHYGDHVPPAYSSQDREVLNGHGVAVRFVDGAATQEEIDERARLAALAEAEEIAAREQARHDKMLLDTYLSVDDIVRLRDQRLDLIEAQINVTEQYLANLTQRLMELEQSAQRFSPRSPDPDARPMPENLALNLEQTTDSIALYEETLTRSRDRQENLSASFADDIARYRILTGGVENRASN